MLGLVRPRESISAYPQKLVAVAGEHGFGLGPRAAAEPLPAAPTIGVFLIKDSRQGCFDGASGSLKLGSKVDAACLREDCRLDRRCLRQVSELRIPGLGTRTDRGALQEAPEPSCFRTTANVGRTRWYGWQR